MTRPLPPTEALDEQERALARIVRALPGGEPPAALDARILKSAANAAASSRRPGARWLASTGALWGIGGAAAAVLALGVGWQMRYGAPRPLQPASSAVSAPKPADDDASVAVDFKDGPAAARSQMAAEPAVAPAAAPVQPSLARDSAPVATRSVPAPAANAAAPPPPPAPSLPQAFSDDHLDEHVASRAETMAGAATAAATEAQARDSATMAKAVAGAARERPAVVSAEAAPQAAGQLAAAGPAVAAPAGPMKPSTWLAHVRALRDQQRPAEARASLREFRRRHPDFVIPSDLARLLRE